MKQFSSLVVLGFFPFLFVSPNIDSPPYIELELIGNGESEWGHTNAFFHSPLAIGVRAVILQLA